MIVISDVAIIAVFVIVLFVVVAVVVVGPGVVAVVVLSAHQKLLLKIFDAEEFYSRLEVEAEAFMWNRMKRKKQKCKEKRKGRRQQRKTLKTR